MEAGGEVGRKQRIALPAERATADAGDDSRQIAGSAQ